ncbi:MAG: gluconate 2-dehydrogenase subunit 3 family protein [Acidobacteriia bacterium]|nr:gluconate 2-dehydrogenase subunit 3 family protein [Terriglobia bacterium]
MDRRELFRRTLWGAAGIAAGAVPRAGAREFPPDYDASRDMARANWKPSFLDDHQNETLLALSDRIIPQTDTPGAKEALVNRFIDRLLAAESRETQREFLEAMAYLDGECMVRYRTAFRYLPAESQVDLLRLLAYPHSLATWGSEAAGESTGYKHFSTLKEWVSRAFYSSEVGMRELGWDGPPHGEFAGCTHPDGSHK